MARRIRQARRIKQLQQRRKRLQRQRKKLFESRIRSQGKTFIYNRVNGTIQQKVASLVEFAKKVFDSGISGKRTMLIRVWQNGKWVRLSDLPQEVGEVTFEYPSDFLSVNIPTGIRRKKYLKQQIADIYYWFSSFIDGERSHLMLDFEKTKIIFAPKAGISEERYFQVFRDGATHCVLQPIKNWIVGRMEAVKGEKAKKEWRIKLNRINKWIDGKYSKGVPEDELAVVCKSFKIGIRIHNLTSGLLGMEEKPFLEFNHPKRNMKEFHFTNTRKNHVETRDISTEVYSVSKECMERKVEDLRGKFFLYQGKLDGEIYKVATEDGTWVLDDEYNDIVNDFEDRSGLWCAGFDAVMNYDLFRFVYSGILTNGTVDYCELGGVDCWKHIDMEKAYANGHRCVWYEGYLGKITDFRRVTRDVEWCLGRQGLWRLTSICGGEGKVADWVRKLDYLCDGVILGTPEVRMLKENGFTFKIVEGCWGVKELDFVIDGDMMKKFGGVPVYSKYTGCCERASFEKTMKMEGSDENMGMLPMISHLDDVSIFTEEVEGRKIATLTWVKEHMNYLGHFTAYVKMYQRLTMIEQLARIDGEVGRICVDGIYFKGQAQLIDLFRAKDDKTFGNVAGEKYVTGASCKQPKDELLDEDGVDIWSDTSDSWDFWAEECDDERFDLEGVNTYLGAGGTGKTYMNLTDSGLVDTLYVAPSYLLAYEKKKELGCDVVGGFMNLIGADRKNWRKHLRKYSNIVVDEVSMMIERGDGGKGYIPQSKREIIDAFVPYGVRLIFCGDVGYQLPPVSGDVFVPEGRVVCLKKNYRFEDESLAEHCKKVRKMIKAGCDAVDLEAYLYDALNSRMVTDIEEYCAETDMILCSTNKECAGWTGKFAGGTKKWRVTRNKPNANLYNGMIVLGDEPKNCGAKLAHGFTIHSVQGQTCSGRVYLVLDRMFDPRLIYTAMSRCRRLEQLFIVV